MTDQTPADLAPITPDPLPVSSESNTQRPEMPVGVALIMIWLGFGAITSLGGVIQGEIVLLGYHLIGVLLWLYVLTMAGIHLVPLVGLALRASWGRWLAVGNGALSFAMSFLYGAYIIVSPESMDEMTQLAYSEPIDTPNSIGTLVGLLIPLFGMVVNVPVIVYLIRKDEYFEK